MSKVIHSMIRVLDEEKSVQFYSHAFDLKIADKFVFDGFTLIYLRNPENDFELELTVNHGREEAYQHGDGYGHMAVVTENLEQEHQKLQAYNPTPIKEFHRDGSLMAKFFFVTDPDGYKVEVIQKHGRYQ